MEFIDARRLTGPSLLFDAPGAILDVACTSAEAERVVPAWEAAVRRMLAAIGWRGEPEFGARRFEGGISIGFTAPIDALYAAVEVGEWAWAQCSAEQGGAGAPDFDAAAARIGEATAAEANPDLLALASAAASHGATLLWDDDEASLGLGRHARTWPVRALPDPGSLDWDVFADVPLALVTGTNGKTTTVRLAAHIVREAGLSAGFSSTDFIAINDRIVDRDDWSGPGGARAVLRENGVDVAILETARGGLLRRGLGVARADAALITNIAEDHLGDFGSRNLDELLDCKWIVSRAVVERGSLVLNADDPLLVARALSFPGVVVWFSLDAQNETVRRHVDRGGAAFIIEGDDLVLRDGSSRQRICAAADIPVTLGGAARHNVANALAAAALAWSLDIGLDAVRHGLTSMTQDTNPGRGNVYAVGGFTVVVDFAHNPRALDALLDTAGRLGASRKALCFGQAGDRPDALIRELARSAWCAGLDRVFVSELEKYHRGRGHGEVYAVIRDELIRCGARPDQVEHREREIESLDAALAWARPGDLVIMLALERSADIGERLRTLSEPDA